jgi:heme-degrading monooxygenase HmoA
MRSDATEIGAAKFFTITEVSPARDGSTASDMPAASDMPNASDIIAAPSGATPPGDLQLDTEAHGLLDHQVFESVTNPGKLLILVSWLDQSVAAIWRPKPGDGAGEVRHRQVRVIRDYVMFDRREAPQFYPDVATAARH